VSEQRYRSLFRMMDQGFCILERVENGPDGRMDFRYVTTNPAFARHTGLGDATGKTIRQLVPAAEQSILDTYDEVLRTGRRRQFEAYVSGLDLWMEADAFATDEPGQIAVLFTNINDRKRAETALKASARRQAVLLKLSDMQRAVSDPVELRRLAVQVLGEELGLARAYFFDVEHDADGQWAHRIERGYQRDPDAVEFVGPYPLSDFGGGMFEGIDRGEAVAVADIETAPGLTEAQRASYRAVGVAAFVNVPLLRDGQYVAGIGAHATKPHRWTQEEIDLIREVAARSWTASERARVEAALELSEARYRSLFDSIDEGFCTIEVLFDGDGQAVDYRFLETNAAFERQTGIRNAAGARMRELAPDHEQLWFDIYGRIARTGSPERFEQQAKALGFWYDVYAFRTGEPHQHRVGILFNDITDRKRHEAALHESRQRYQALVTASTYTIYRMSPDWRTMYQLNSETLAITADPIEGWIDKYILDDDRPMVSAAIERAIETKSLFELEHRVWLADGKIGWVLSRAVPLLGPDGEITEWFGAGSDVTARREAAERERVSEERLRQFGEASQDILWLRDAETLQWVYLNPAFETIYGVGRDQALAGDNYRNWQDLIVPEDRERAVAAIDRVRGSAWVTFEYRIRRPGDGAIRWLRNTDFPITDEAGKVILIGGVGHDFTEVRNSERRFRSLVEGVPQLIWRAVDGGEWTWASPQWTDCTGQARDAYRGWGWLAALHPDDRAKARDAWVDAREHGGFELEYRLRRRRYGDYRWFQTRATAVYDEHGAIVEWLGTSTDIHELRRLQELQGTLLAELQHRVRNILAVTRSIVRRSDDGERPTQDYVAHLEGRISALARTQVMLTRAAGIGVDLEEMILDELLAQAAPETQFELVGHPVQLSPKAAEVLTLAVHELATNSTKYGAFARPGAHITIGWEVEDRAGASWLILDWRETGVPILDAAPRRRGFGAELVSRRIPYELNGSGLFELRPGGLHSRIEFPLMAGDSILQTNGVQQ
jgi:PAS domain S-box-containing protein